MAPYVYVRFRRAGPAFAYDAQPLPHLQVGEYVVVRTPRGPQVGWVIRRSETLPENTEAPKEKVLRVATPRDLVLWQLAQNKALEALVNARALARNAGVREVRFILVEVSLDHQTYTFEYHTENEPESTKAWKRFLQQVQKAYPGRTLNFVRLGARDAAKWEGGLGVCGMERCCSAFLIEFQPVQMRMAKEQNLSLAGGDITGACGRLRCCLAFEQPVYQALRADLPRLKSRIETPRGRGKVVEVRPLQGQVVVELEEDRTRIVLTREDLALIGDPPCPSCPQAAAA